MTAPAPAGADSGRAGVEFPAHENTGTDPAARARADAHAQQLQDVAYLLTHGRRP